MDGRQRPGARYSAMAGVLAGAGAPFTRRPSHTYSSRWRVCAPSCRQPQTMTTRITSKEASARDAMKTLVRRLRRLEAELVTQEDLLSDNANRAIMSSYLLDTKLAHIDSD